MVRISQSATFSAQSYFHDREGQGISQPLTHRINPHSKPIVSYYFPQEVGEHHYGERHPMKPHRLTLTNHLVLGYGLDKRIHNILSPRAATEEELIEYHDRDYIEFLSRVSPENQSRADIRGGVDQFNCVEDCPIFTDMYDFFKLYTGGSIAGARRLCVGTTDIAINWSGGLHHAKRGEASGFCYINDIVLAILQLLRHHPRVLYIDIDIHHGDGVELAFWQSNRVMTVSFHKYTGEFFPGTGKLDDNGGGLGKHFALNVPLQDGIDDESYLTVFKTVIEDTVNSFRPSSIVLQCGADSLGCDRLGAFNLSIAAHGECVDFVQKFNVPLLVLGGGGYTIHNVSRCWTYETAVLVGAEVPDELPHTSYDAYFAPDYKLHAPIVSKVENMNTPASLQKITTSIRNKLRYLQGAPSVQLQHYPPDLADWLDEQVRNPEELDDDKGTGQAGEGRDDPHKGANEYFDGEGDNDSASGSGSARKVAPVVRGAGAPRRRARAGRPRTRGRGRGAVGRPSNLSKQVDVDGDSNDNSSSGDDAPTRAKRGRGGGRRGRRPRARGARGGRDDAGPSVASGSGTVATPSQAQPASPSRENCTIL